MKKRRLIIAAQQALTPRLLYLIDGLGAVFSAFLLGIVLVRFEEYFGIPPKTLYFLACLPCFFAIYDFYCYAKIKQNHRLFFKIIGFTNLLYCCISLGLAFYHHTQITYLGWLYMLTEIFIVSTLAYVELKAVDTLESNVSTEIN